MKSSGCLAAAFELDHLGFLIIIQHYELWQPNHHYNWWTTVERTTNIVRWEIILCTYKIFMQHILCVDKFRHDDSVNISQRVVLLWPHISAYLKKLKIQRFADSKVVLTVFLHYINPVFKKQILIVHQWIMKTLCLNCVYTTFEYWTKMHSCYANLLPWKHQVFLGKAYYEIACVHNISWLFTKLSWNYSWTGMLSWFSMLQAKSWN